MNIASHKRTLGIIHLVLGILSLFVFGIILIVLNTVLPIVQTEIVQEEGPEAGMIIGWISGAVVTFIMILGLLGSLPSIIGGIATLQKKKWGLVVLLIAGCLSLFSFPVGTAVGVYSIWVYVEQQKLNKEKT